MPSAFAASVDAGLPRVCFPPLPDGGVYLVAGNSSVHGPVVPASVRHVYGGGTLQQAANTNADYNDVLHVWHHDGGLLIEDLTLLGASRPQTSASALGGLVVRRSRDVTVRGVRFRWLRGPAVWLDAATRVTLDGLDVTESGAAVAITSSHFVTLTGSRFTHSALTEFQRIVGVDSVDPLPGRGLNDVSTDLLIRGNVFDDYADVQSIQFHSGAHVVVERNWLTNVSWGVSINPYAAEDTCEDIATRHNVLLGATGSQCRSPALNYGHSVGGAPGTPRDISFTDNDVVFANACLLSNTGAGIAVGHAANVLIARNRFAAAAVNGVSLQLGRSGMESVTGLDVRDNWFSLAAGAAGTWGVRVQPNVVSFVALATVRDNVLRGASTLVDTAPGLVASNNVALPAAAPQLGFPCSTATDCGGAACLVGPLDAGFCTAAAASCARPFTDGVADGGRYDFFGSGYECRAGQLRSAGRSNGEPCANAGDCGSGYCGPVPDAGAVCFGAAFHCPRPHHDGAMAGERYLQGGVVYRCATPGQLIIDGVADGYPCSGSGACVSGYCYPGPDEAICLAAAKNCARPYSPGVLFGERYLFADALYECRGGVGLVWLDGGL